MTRGGNLNPKLRVPLHHLMGCAPNGTPAYSNFSDDTFTNIENGPVPFVLHAHSSHAGASDAADGSSPTVAASAHLSETAAALIEAIVPHPNKDTPHTGPATFGTGYKWQCVEFARRWLWDAKGLVLPDIPIAALIIHVPYVYRPDGTQAPVRAVWNGGTERPTADSLIIYRSRAGAFVGHVGVIVEVTDTEVRIADQNRHFHAWGDQMYAAAYPLVQRNGLWYIEDPEEKVHGWLTFPDAPSVSKDALPGALTAPAPEAVPANEAAVPYRPVPPQMRYGVPEYPSAVSKQLWKSAFAAFHPTPLLFPVVFGYEITRIAVVMSARYVWGKIRPAPPATVAEADVSTAGESLTNEAPIADAPTSAAAEVKSN